MHVLEQKSIIGVNPDGPTGRAFEGGGFDTETGAIGTTAAPIDDTASPRDERERGGTDIFFAAVEATRMPMIVTDPRQPDNPIVFCNPAFVQMTGYEPHEIEGRNCRFLQGPDSDPAVIAELRRAIEERREISVELLNYRKNGSAFWNALFMSPVFDKDGQLVYYFASQLDVSRRRDAEDALRQAQKMEALGQLTGGIAHDFNNLLQVIVGYLDGLKARVPDVPSDYLQRAVDAMALAADRGATLTQQLLAFARKQRLDGRLVNINSLVEGLEPLITRTLGPTVTVDNQLAPDLPNVKLDSTQAELALLNVLINARDAMDGSGRIRIETRPLEVGGDDPRAGDLAPGRYAELAITDTGSGIPPEILKRVTEPFFTTKEQGRGTGLGLSMVYGFAKQSGGALRIDSDVGRGTVVRLLFPAVDAPRDPLAAAPRQPERGRQAECVLVVEDQDDVGDLAQSILEDFGYRVLRAANGTDALRIVEGDERIDLLFTDLIMPGGMNGVTLAREARRARPRLRVLLTTGYAERSGATEEASTSEFELIAKPYRRSDLAARVRRAIDGPTGVS